MLCWRQSVGMDHELQLGWKCWLRASKDATPLVIVDLLVLQRIPRWSNGRQAVGFGTRHDMGRMGRGAEGRQISFRTIGSVKNRERP